MTYFAPDAIYFGRNHPYDDHCTVVVVTWFLPVTDGLWRIFTNSSFDFADSSSLLMLPLSTNSYLRSFASDMAKTSTQRFSTPLRTEKSGAKKLKDTYA